MKLWRWRCTLWIVDVHTYSTSGHVESESERHAKMQTGKDLKLFLSLLVEILGLVLIALMLIEPRSPKCKINVT